MGITVTDRITSRNNPKISDASKLSDRKYRDSGKVFSIEGIKLLEEAVGCGAEFVRMFVTDTALQKYGDTIGKAACPEIYSVTDEVYEKLTAENAPQGIFCVLKYYEPDSKKQSGDSVVMVLDEVSDPGNLGTIIRCADAMNIDCVYIGDNGADIYNPKTVRACMGSLFRVRTVRGNAVGFVSSLQKDGYKVYAAVLDEKAIDIRKADISGKTAFVVGNEGRGVSHEVSSVCDGSVIIPMKDGVQSLNAAVAASMLMWEAARTRFK